MSQYSNRPRRIFDDALRVANERFLANGGHSNPGNKHNLEAVNRAAMALDAHLRSRSAPRNYGFS